MSRRRTAEVREVNPDARYGSKDVAKFINCLMEKGKKSVVERALYKAFDEIAQKMGMDAIQVFEEVLEKIKPLVEVRPKRVGGATYQVPFEVRPRRAKSLAFRWIIIAARSRKDKKTLAQKLAAEFMDAYAGRGVAMKKKEDTHKMAEANRAFAHYVW
jgi:small subunit ribosomal protein S7